MKIVVITYALLTLSVLTPAASAQTIEAGEPQQVMKKAAARSWTIRVSTQDGRTVAGRVTALSDTSFVISRQPIRLLQISQIERRERGVGPLPLIVGGAGLAWGLSTLDPDSGCKSGCVMGRFAVAGLLMMITAAFTSETDWEVLWKK